MFRNKLVEHLILQAAQERDRYLTQLAEEREAHRKERQELLNRLAQPQVSIRDVQDVPPLPPPSKDHEELAAVGQIIEDDSPFRRPEEL